jgi:hypothetical protein
MRHLLFVPVLAVAACAAPAPENVQSVGQSAHAPAAVAQCIALNWANSSGQTIYMQHVLANDRAFDVYAPGQKPPGGSAAVIRPAPTGTGSSVGLRGGGGNAASSVNACL